jgi:FlaG/FlaF family flagellin (archaellin)
MITLPTLTEYGLVTDKNILMVNLFRYFVSTQKSQSVIYSRYIESYDYLLKQYGADPESLRDQVTNSLTRLYKRYYVEVEVNITINDAVLNIDIGATDEYGKIYTLSSNTTNDIITQLENIMNLYI